MGRNKLEKFEYVERSENVFQQGKPSFEAIKGRWNQDFFKNDNKITLELGCGKGEYTIGLAEQFPERNFIGIDIKGNRLYTGAKQANEANIRNVAFLRTQILMLENFFEKGEVDEIWVTFPDPRMKDRDERRRLISPRFLELYKKVLKEGGMVNLKTDSAELFEYSSDLIDELSLEVKARTNDLYSSEYEALCYGLQTTYEKMYLAKGVKINYMKFVLSE